MLIKATDTIRVGGSGELLFPKGTEWKCEEGCGRVSQGGVMLHASDCPANGKYLFRAAAILPPSGSGSV